MRAIAWAALPIGLAAACSATPPCPAADLAPLARDPAFAIVTSDRTVTAIALLDADGSLITEAWIDSGTTRPGVSATLSGDVVLPTEPLGDGALALIDRFGVDVVTRIAIPNGDVLSQTHTQLSAAESTSGFRANPQDVVRLDDTRLLVSRHTPNLDPDAPELERGNDLAIIDLDARAPVARIDLSALDVSAGKQRFYARPARMVSVDETHVIVGLARASRDFIAGPGAIAIADPTGAAAPVALELDGLANCGEVVRSEDDPSHALVLCAGDTFTACSEERRPRSGIVELAVDTGAHVVRVLRAAGDPSLPVPSAGLVSIGADRVLFAAMGDECGTLDRVVALDLASGAFRVLLESSEILAFGYGVYDRANRRALVPDARAGSGIHVLAVGDSLDAIIEERTIDVSPCRRLPAREARALIAVWP